MTTTTNAAAESRLRIHEIFYSLQGEARFVGAPTVFVRLSGCPLRCRYCDTAYAFHGGQWMTLEEVITAVASYPVKRVTITGGEPLAQRPVLTLMKKLCDQDYQVSIETGGMLNIGDIDARVCRVLDLKTPGSDMANHNHWGNLQYLTKRDMVKFVICNENDYQWSLACVAEHQLTTRCEVYFSPSYGEVAPRTLADWIIRDGVDVRLQIQLHKHLWGDVPGK